MYMKCIFPLWILVLKKRPSRETSVMICKWLVSPQTLNLHDLTHSSKVLAPVGRSRHVINWVRSRNQVHLRQRRCLPSTELFAEGKEKVVIQGVLWEMCLLYSFVKYVIIQYIATSGRLYCFKTDQEKQYRNCNVWTMLSPSQAS